MTTGTTFTIFGVAMNANGEYQQNNDRRVKLDVASKSIGAEWGKVYGKGPKAKRAAMDDSARLNLEEYARINA